MSPDDLITPGEALAILQVDYQTLWKWTTDRKIRSTRVGTHGWHRYRRGDIEALREPSSRPGWENYPKTRVQIPDYLKEPEPYVYPERAPVSFPERRWT